MSKGRSFDFVKAMTKPVVTCLQRGKIPWHTTADNQPAHLTMGPMTGINKVALRASAEVSGFASPLWLTYADAERFGGRVLKGERPATVVMPDSLGEPKARRLYNVEQTSGLRFVPATGEPSPRMSLAELVHEIDVELTHGGQSHYYDPACHRVLMPPLSAFISSQHYDVALLECLAAWACERSLGAIDADRNSLYHSLTMAFLGPRLGVETGLVDHADRGTTWARRLLSDPRQLFHAAFVAQDAANYVLTQSSEPMPARAA